MISPTCSITKTVSIIAICKQKSSLVHNSSTSLVHKQTNLVTHSLALASRFYANPHMFHDVSNSICVLLLNDMR
ncbi:hypothetical protein JHK84_056348 [Glycine max]|nr:hypothetical protein JHK84_056348 [Glycine max]